MLGLAFRIPLPRRYVLDVRLAKHEDEAQGVVACPVVIHGEADPETAAGVIQQLLDASGAGYSQ